MELSQISLLKRERDLLTIHRLKIMFGQIVNMWSSVLISPSLDKRKVGMSFNVIKKTLKNFILQTRYSFFNLD